MKWEYLIFNLLIFIGSSGAAFFYKKTVWPKFKPLLLSILIPAFVFIIWDFFAVNNFWYFNPLFITGIKIFDLPFEEILFFFTVPFASLLIWINIWNKFKNKNIIFKFPHKAISLILILLGFVMVVLGLYYSAVTLFVLAVAIALDCYLKANLLNNYLFYIFLIIVVALTLIFNGYLTARPIVTYNEMLKTNINVYTIPLEDIFYGGTLILLNAIFYKKFS